MNRLVLLLVFFVACSFSYRIAAENTHREDPFSLFNRLFQEGQFNNYNAARLGKKYEQYYSQQSDRSMFLQALATYYSFSGDTNKADSVWTIFINPPTNEIHFDIKGNINDLIAEISKHQVVMFNEVHHVPKHRYVVGMLLDTLFQRGFRYLALEAFWNDSLFLSLNFPTTENGFYLREPTFANLVRKAHTIGYRIIGYDVFAPSREERSRGQAENIYNQTLKTNKEARVLVLAGVGHISRNGMAGELERISGVRPFTVNQTLAYATHLRNRNIPQNTVLIINDARPNLNTFGADLLILNSLKIENNCFSSVDAVPTSIIVPNSFLEKCSIIAIYAKHEFDYFINNEIVDWRLLPVAVHRPKNGEIIVNLCKGEYVVLFLNDYGEILFSKEMIVSAISRKK